MTIAEQSHAACGVAHSAAGPGNDGWNDRFIASVRGQGFELIPLNPGEQLGKDGPLMAPVPYEIGTQYPYPSVVAPAGWVNPYKK